MIKEILAGLLIGASMVMIIYTLAKMFCKTFSNKFVNKKTIYTFTSK